MTTAVSTQQHMPSQRAHFDSVPTNESFYSLRSSPNPENDTNKPRTVNVTPKMNTNKSCTRLFSNTNKSPFSFSSKNDSSTTVSAAASIFERDVESNASIFTLSNTSVNNLPTHHKSENFIPPALNASVEALNDNRRNYKDIDIIVSSSATRHSCVLFSSLSPRKSESGSAPARNSSVVSNSSPKSHKCMTFNSPKRRDSIRVRRDSNTSMSVEDLVRNRKNSAISFFSYADYLEEEALTKESPVAPQNLFADPELMSRKSSISKMLMQNANASPNYKCNAEGLPTPSMAKRSKSGRSNVPNTFYSHNDSSNISVIDEIKLKSMMVRKMSNLDDALHETVTPKIPDSPTASPVAFNPTYDPNSVLSSPIRTDDEMDIDSDEQFDDFEITLGSAFLHSDSTRQQNLNSNLNIWSLDEVLRNNQKEIALEK